jgi:uncharacterized membrane protein YeaQ/YmgE (transglycosylase-associated protein family)
MMVPRRRIEESVMSLEAALIWILVGAVAGWLAGQIVKGGDFGLVGDIVIGIIGAFIGGWLFGGIVVVGGIVGMILSATLGAVILLVVIRVLRRA